MKTTTLIFLIAYCFPGLAQNNPQLPHELELVIQYIQKVDYPELFNNNPYQLRPVDWKVIDIDNDRKMEVFLQTFPHYRQSPTITIYQVDSGEIVTKIIEGLAPGRLIPLNKKDDYLDPHTTGSAIDLQMDEADHEKMKVFARTSLKFGMSPVLYKNFIHTDKRDGKSTFLDLSYLEYKKETSCAKFQFSQPEAITAGQIKGKKSKYFLALVEDEIYCYAIKGFTFEGWIDKELTIIKKPAGFKSFVVEDGYINYLTTKGEKKELIL